MHHCDADRPPRGVGFGNIAKIINTILRRQNQGRAGDTGRGSGCVPVGGVPGVDWGCMLYELSAEALWNTAHIEFARLPERTRNGIMLYNAKSGPSGRRAN